LRRALTFRFPPLSSTDLQNSMNSASSTAPVPSASTLANCRSNSSGVQLMPKEVMTALNSPLLIAGVLNLAKASL
jgi:hypothetical protein